MSNDKKISELVADQPLPSVNTNVAFPVRSGNYTYGATWGQFRNDAEARFFKNSADAPSSAPDFSGQVYVRANSDKDVYIGTDVSASTDFHQIMKQDADGNWQIPTGSQLYFESSNTISAPTGTTFTMDADDGNCQFVDLEAVTGNVTASFDNFKVGTYILVVEHDSTARTLTFPSAYLVGVTGTSTTAFSLDAGGTKRTLFTIYYDGTNYYITETKFYA